MIFNKNECNNLGPVPAPARVTTMNVDAETVGQLRNYTSSWAKSQLRLRGSNTSFSLLTGPLRKPCDGRDEYAGEVHCESSFYTWICALIGNIILRQ